MSQTMAQELAVHAPRMYRVALRIVGDTDSARDVAQDACVRALRGAKQFDGRSTLATWLHRITVNCAHDHLRKDRQRDRRRADWNSETAGMLSTLKASPAERAEQGELYGMALDLVAALPDDCRSAFMLTQLDGYPMRKYMAATEGKLWLAGNNLGLSQPLLMYSHAQDELSPLRQVPYGVNAVAATTDRVFFAADTGLYKFDTNGTLLKHYDQKNAALPGDRITDVCEGGGKIYFGFQGSPSGGVAVLDPASDTVPVLAPSSRDAKRQDEPLLVSRLRWDAATPRLYAYFNPYPYYEYPKLTGEFSWTPQSKAWQSYPIKEAPWLVVSQGDEALLVRNALPARPRCGHLRRQAKWSKSEIMSGIGL